MSDNILLAAAAIAGVAWWLHRKGTTEAHPFAAPAIATAQGSVGMTAAQTGYLTAIAQPNVIVTPVPVPSGVMYMPEGAQIGAQSAFDSGLATSSAGIVSAAPTLSYEAPAPILAPILQAPLSVNSSYSNQAGTAPVALAEDYGVSYAGLIKNTWIMRMITLLQDHDINTGGATIWDYAEHLADTYGYGDNGMDPMEVLNAHLIGYSRAGVLA